MILKELISELDYTLYNGDENVEITELVCDSRKIVKGCIFVCIKGTVFDGHTFIDEAIKQGAAAIITEDEVEITQNRKNTTFIAAADCRNTLALVSAAYFGHPSKRLFTIGITGTKGKTTTAFMVREILERCGYKTGLIGTIEIITGSRHIESANTTPESYDVQRYFKEMADNGCKCVVMEVSSQALMMKRCAGITFDIGVFTNLEPDHIGPNEHASFEDYMHCKGLLFKQCKIGIVNFDDEHTNKVLEGHTCSVETYGLNEGANLRAVNIQYVHEPGHISTEYDIEGEKLHIKLSLPGKFSVYNSMCAVAVTRHLDVDEEKLKEALLTVAVKGRVEPVKVSDKFILMIDYAHNAMSLKSILETLREYNPKRLVSVFGCGGNRSKLRRYEMGEVSGKLADFTIITSDNPRFEEPLDIIADIRSSIEKTGGDFIEIPDRKEAIRYAIEHGREGDIIVLAGKGHEDYQEIKGVKYPMDERVLIKEVLEELKCGSQIS
jgi:UDP-N-acetylmuramoyl-L-alanyl-D-glutamate--2,6-diaminopimelate ligase